MRLFAVGLLLLPAGLLLYAYVIYPVLLWLAGRGRPLPAMRQYPEEWPEVTIVVPAYNEEASIGTTIESLLQLDYPRERRHILVVSDASTDRTDQIVQSFEDRGVELLRQPSRAGKDAGEIAALPRLRGDIVVNTDATIRILPDSLKPLIRALDDPTVGVASGRDVSVGDIRSGGNRGESGYVGYEMWLRGLETRLGSIVGASGCFYAIRRSLHGAQIPPGYSRDFASVLVAREQGYRSVSVAPAVCLVPRTASLQREYRRKIRTMSRGLRTLWLKRHLLNPVTYDTFSWMLWSHKLARWLVFPAAPLALVGLGLLATGSGLARLLLGAVACGLLVSALGWKYSGHPRLPRLVAVLGFVLAAQVAGCMAWIQALRGTRTAVWEPTRRII